MLFCTQNPTSSIGKNRLINLFSCPELSFPAAITFPHCLAISFQIQSRTASDSASHRNKPTIEQQRPCLPASYSAKKLYRFVRRCTSPRGRQAALSLRQAPPLPICLSLILPFLSFSNSVRPSHFTIRSVTPSSPSSRTPHTSSRVRTPTHLPPPPRFHLVDHQCCPAQPLSPNPPHTILERRWSDVESTLLLVLVRFSPHPITGLTPASPSTTAI